MNHHVARLLAAERIADLKRAARAPRLASMTRRVHGLCAGDFLRPLAGKDGTAPADAPGAPPGETPWQRRSPLPKWCPSPVVLLNEGVLLMQVGNWFDRHGRDGCVWSLCWTALAAVTRGWECVPTTAGQAVSSGRTGASPFCGASSTPVLATTYVALGVGNKAQFSGVNVQVVDGSGAAVRAPRSPSANVPYDSKAARPQPDPIRGAAARAATRAPSTAQFTRSGCALLDTRRECPPDRCRASLARFSRKLSACSPSWSQTSAKRPSMAFHDLPLSSMKGVW